MQFKIVDAGFFLFLVDATGAPVSFPDKLKRVMEKRIDDEYALNILDRVM